MAKSRTDKYIYIYIIMICVLQTKMVQRYVVVRSPQKKIFPDQAKVIVSNGRPAES